jgi:NAD-dependent deacetylase
MRVVVLTGAGISAESGVPTFRDANGLWEGHRVEEVATPAAFEAQPTIVQRFYDARRRALHAVMPNAGHLALAALERALGKRLLLVTQNIDDLHERAGSSHVVHMHGELFSALCRACGGRSRWKEDLVDRPGCPACGVSELRPDVVWFGEIPYEMDRIHRALTRADLFVSIGTSGAVYPAAGFVRTAAAHGARTLELNLQRSDGTDWFHDARHGPASRLVPVWVKELLSP